MKCCGRFAIVLCAVATGVVFVPQAEASPMPEIEHLRRLGRAK